jgi:hypothetical protein
MKKFGLKTITWYGILALVVAVAILPLLKAAAPQYFPSLDGFRDLDCQGVTCAEGQFCAEGKRCVNIATRYPNAVPTGNE